MDQAGKERRKYKRFDTEAKIYFRVTYDIKTIVKFRVVDQDKKRLSSKKYFAISKNVSAEGLCFTSDKKLEKGNILQLEIYLPRQKKPIPMTGEVRWSQSTVDSKKKTKFDTGVKLMAIGGEPVSKSIYYDEANHVIWSAVLESIFGSFRKFIQKTATFKFLQKKDLKS